ncbi:MAG: hypothetical protein EON59_12580 [Alphaproteobacteria bacterium]|nr:MAG: hypothetical protein EON59_12580 [Alphaproteobacteria bacterium]
MRDRRLSGADRACLFEIVERYRSEHGNARASHGYLARTIGVTPRAVFDCVARLVGLDYVTVVRPCSGPRPTEYLPNWSLGIPVKEDVEADFNIEVPFSPADVEADFNIGLQSTSTMEPPRVEVSFNPIPLTSGYQTGDVRGDSARGSAAGLAPAPAAAVETVIGAEYVGREDGAKVIRLDLDSGATIDVVHEHPLDAVQRVGTRHIDQLTVAGGIEHLDDHRQFVGTRFIRAFEYDEAGSATLAFRPAPATAK